MDWKALEADTAAAVKTALSDLRATYPGEVFYACAVYTDSGAMTLGVAANSKQALDRKLDREAEAERSELRPYYTWCTSEWAYEAWRGECFRAVCMDLASAEPKEDFGVFRERLSQLMIDVLAGLRSQGFFEAVFSEVPVLFVTVTDDAGAEGLEDRSARVLNTEAVFREFVQRYPAIIV